VTDGDRIVAIRVAPGNSVTFQNRDGSMAFRTSPRGARIGLAVLEDAALGQAGDGCETLTTYPYELTP
jgi:hypothetical protein